VKLSKLIFLSVAGVMIAVTSQALAAGDIAKGKKFAKKCKSCHTFKEGGKNGLGPNLFGILGKPAGVVEGYKYSKAMSSSGIVWDDSIFIEFITKPKKVIKGTKMSFKGIRKATQRADLLAYFSTLRSETANPVDAGNVEDGILVAKNHCTVCHTFNKGGKVVYGPNLFNIAGKPAGAIDDYNYSAAMKKSGLTWTDKNLVGFLANPEQFIKGTKARFPGLKSAKQKADILAYIKTLK
jgi:cytochrome c